MKPWKTTAPPPQFAWIPSFNGATAMKPWKTWPTVWRGGWERQLQWGHGDEAVEDLLKKRLKAMGDEPLQWGHGDEAVEDN